MPAQRFDHAGFDDLLGRLGAAWAACDAAAAAGCFTADATYMEPPDHQLFRGTAELTAYFSPLRPGTFLQIHRSWFDEAGQSGACEFTFGARDRDIADHGVAVVQLTGGLISSWREYPREGPAAFGDFVNPDGKRWTWHSGNYP